VLYRLAAFCFPARQRSPLFELASVLVHLNHIASCIVNAHNRRVKYWEIIADNLRKAGWRCGCISSTDHKGRQFWVVAADREGDGRFIEHADEMLTAFVELESATLGRIAPRLAAAIG
jgi:hypothetical protein